MQHVEDPTPLRCPAVHPSEGWRCGMDREFPHKTHTVLPDMASRWWKANQQRIREGEVSKPGCGEATLTLAATPPASED